MSLYKPFTLKDFDKFIKDLQKNQAPREQVWLGSKNDCDYLDAVIKNDKGKMAELQEKFAKEAEERKEREYAWLRNNLSIHDFNVFSEIDKTYERHIGWTDGANIMGSSYKYYWKSDEVQIEYNNYGEFGLFIRFKEGVFSLSIYYCDETGYDQDMYWIEKDIKPSDIIARIADIKEKVLNGFKINLVD